MSMYIQKIKVRHQSINEILKTKENWNLIGLEHFFYLSVFFFMDIHKPQNCSGMKKLSH